RAGYVSRLRRPLHDSGAPSPPAGNAREPGGGDARRRRGGIHADRLDDLRRVRAGAAPAGEAPQRQSHPPRSRRRRRDHLGAVHRRRPGLAQPVPDPRRYPRAVRRDRVRGDGHPDGGCAQADRASQRLAVFFLDLDRFKEINDSLGHTVGDALLKSVADRIRRCVREGDTVARFGGDEFTLLIPRVENVEDAAKIAQKILETLKIPFSIAEHELFVTASIGISVYPTDGVDPETLVRNADTAMYRAKDQGRDNYQLYAPAMNARALERLALENMLRKALSHRELVLFYQPVAEMRTKSIVGVEALIRWQHPELGLLS